MPDERFSFYADKFAEAARAGQNGAQSLFKAIDAASNANPLSFEVFEDAITIKNQMIDNIQSAYETIFTAAIALEPMRQAFVELSKHIEKQAGQSVDNYLSERNIQVDATYASISALFGRPITSGNIR